ncbi:hypothetical protein H257_18030 [Aphanomyces astaci]|uniref:subtilisin n=1 Tax=Aphanomyces astaci TaxID=112090 RepID=W4FEC3_APHAT|nr:hypothetical protein H257_18030 [Aphanomyces astaci]ETV65166.1 hypothetical protein H257_18030 [Aphanomyces astaci]|eukprot:XP_009845340.1 hypothetical protein H257_18030 [Aphanomyces astaci]
MIQAPALWANDIKGEGIVVANIDSGVHYSHESLESNWRSEYGTMMGTKGIGVAPKAKWIVCKGYAAPHVAGAIALYLSAIKGASYDQVIPGLTLPPPSKSTQVLNPTNDLSTCGTLEVNTNYIGGDLALTNQATASCCAECKKTPGCKLFVWYTLEGGMCRLKGTQGQKVAVDGAKAGVLPAPALARPPLF